MEKRHCAHHPDRLAIGMCVETGIPICGECSTRYNGVNYSREGLAILHKRMRAQADEKQKIGWLAIAGPGAVSFCIACLAYWLFGKCAMLWLGTG